MSYQDLKRQGGNLRDILLSEKFALKGYIPYVPTL